MEKEAEKEGALLYGFIMCVCDMFIYVYIHIHTYIHTHTYVHIVACHSETGLSHTEMIGKRTGKIRAFSLHDSFLSLSRSLSLSLTHTHACIRRKKTKHTMTHADSYTHTYMRMYIHTYIRTHNTHIQYAHIDACLLTHFLRAGIDLTPAIVKPKGRKPIRLVKRKGNTHIFWLLTTHAFLSA